MNLRGGPWSGRSRRATGARGRRRRAPSWAAARRTPRAWTRPSCAAARARPGAAPARRHSPRARSRPSLAPPSPSALLLRRPPHSDRLGYDYVRVAVASFPPPSAAPSAWRVENGKAAVPARVLRRAVAPASAYKRGLVPGLGGVTQTGTGGVGARLLHREIARPPADRTIRTVGGNGIIIILGTHRKSSVMHSFIMSVWIQD